MRKGRSGKGRSGTESGLENIGDGRWHGGSSALRRTTDGDEEGSPRLRGAGNWRFRDGFGFLLAADFRGLSEALPAEGRVLEETVFKVDGHAFGRAFAPDAGCVRVPECQCHVHAEFSFQREERLIRLATVAQTGWSEVTNG